MNSFKNYNYKGKTIWITGASSGIGEELAYKFSEFGARLVLSARRIENLNKIAAKCRELSDTHVISLDLTDSISIENAVKSMKQIGKLDLLIHNAGIAQKGLAQDNTDNVEEKVFKTNYFGTVELTKRVLPMFIEQNRGWFAVVSSIAGRIGVPGRSAYSASKHALHGFFESLRAEMYQHNIKVSFVMPGFINTHITVKELTSNGEQYGKVEKSHALGMSSRVCAERIVRSLSKGRENILVGRSEIYGVIINRISPRLYNFIIRNHPVRRLRNFKNFFRISVSNGTKVPLYNSR